MLEYLQQFWDEVLEEDATLLEGTEGSQIMGSKCKEVVSRNKEGQWPSKKARKKQLERYCEDAIVKMGVLTLVRDVCVLGRIAWYTT